MISRKAAHYSLFETDAGWMGIYGSSSGIARTTLPQPTQDEAGLDLGNRACESNCSIEYFQQTIEKIRSYFKGRQVTFDEKLDLRLWKPFEIAVWKTTSAIPYGETRSYAWVAREVGSPLAARAVGSALGDNPVPIIVPCHRVIGSNGKLRGFGGGLEMKQYLLDLETKKRAPLSNRDGEPADLFFSISL